MKINKKHINALASEGIDATTHHATIKKTFKSIFDVAIGKEEIEVIRNLMNGSMTSQEAPVERSQKELVKHAREYMKDIAQDGSRIIDVTEVTAKGNPARVIVKCADPQTNGAGDSVCDKTREVAIQDVFQVLRCVPCQKRTVQIYRNGLARARRKELRERRAS